MTPAEHYARAEQLLREVDVLADSMHGRKNVVIEPLALLVAIAQVHATLATATTAAAGAALLDDKEDR